MEKVSWKDKKSNEEVLKAVGERRSLIKTIRKRKKNWIGHADTEDSGINEGCDRR